MIRHSGDAVEPRAVNRVLEHRQRHRGGGGEVDGAGEEGIAGLFVGVRRDEELALLVWAAEFEGDGGRGADCFDLVGRKAKEGELVIVR